MTLLFVVVLIGIVAGVAVLVARDQPVLEDDPVAPSAHAWPPAGGIGPDDLTDARFTVAVRGYRMDEVDRVLADAASTLAERDRRIAALERRAAPGSARASTAAPTGALTDALADAPEPATLLGDRAGASIDRTSTPGGTDAAPSHGDPQGPA